MSRFSMSRNAINQQQVEAYSLDAEAYRPVPNVVMALGPLC